MLQVQTAFRETGSRLQKILDQRRETEMGMARREQEMKQLANWKATVLKMVESMVEVLAVAAPLGRANDSAPAADLAALSDEVGWAGRRVPRSAASARLLPHAHAWCTPRLGQWPDAPPLSLSLARALCMAPGHVTSLLSAPSSCAHG